MTSVAVKTEFDRRRLIQLIEGRKIPFRCSLATGIPRSIDQNKLQRKWCLEAGQQGDQTAEEYRAECKLTIGVPMLREAADEALDKQEAGEKLTKLEQGYIFFKQQYDRVVKPLPYENKLILMSEPFDFPVTRLMAVDLFCKYLDRMYKHFRDQGFELTEPKQPPMSVYAEGCR